MKTRIIALVLMATAAIASPALARFVVMDANFDNKAAGTQLGRDGALQGEAVPGPWDRFDDIIAAEAAGDNIVSFPDDLIAGRSEMYFGLRDDLAPDDGLLTARWSVMPESFGSYAISLRGSDQDTELVTVIFTASSLLTCNDADGLSVSFMNLYAVDETYEFMIELDVDDGIYTLYLNGAAVISDEAHGLGAHEVANLVFAHPDDGNDDGRMILDDISIDWRPGTASPLLEASFSDKPLGEVIDTRGAFYGEPVSLSDAEPRVEIGPPLGNKALVFRDEDTFSAEFANFEFVGGVEPAQQPVSISFALAMDQADNYSVNVREQGSASAVFLTMNMRENGVLQFIDEAGGISPFLVASYDPDGVNEVELHFEPVFDVYSVWWNGERVIHRRAHGITDRNVGRITFGTLNDQDLDGILYVDRIRAYTLGAPLAVDDAPTPAAPAILLGAVPNPFNPATEIRFELPATAPVTVDIFDGRGRLVRRLVDEMLTAGLHKPVWRGLDRQGRRVASGVYHARVTAGGFGATTSLTLVK